MQCGTERGGMFVSASELTRDLTTGVIHWRDLEGDRLVIDDGCDAKQEDPFEIADSEDLLNLPDSKFCTNCVQRMPEDDIRDDMTEYENSA
jgi:hypothetical protein